MPRITRENLAEVVDGIDWDFLQKFVEVGGKQKAELDRLSKRPPSSSSHASLEEQINSRCQTALIGFKMQEMAGGGLTARGPGAGRFPPVQGGMLDCLNQLKKIVIDDYNASQRSQRTVNYKKIPVLLKRVRSLLRIFYDCQIGQKAHPDLLLCDWPQVFDVGLELHKIALYLSLDRPRLLAVMDGAGAEFETFVLEDPFDVGQYRLIAQALQEAVAKDEEADDDDRMDAGEVESKAGGDLAAHLMGWFYGDLHTALILNEPDGNEKEKKWARKAMKRLVFWSTNHVMRDVVGDSLTDAMKPIYWYKEPLIRFCQAGGMAALIGDWVNSSCQVLCEETLKDLPDECWENQTKKSLAAITKELQYKVAHESSEIVVTPIFVNAMYNMYRHYGISPFSSAGRQEGRDDPVLFYYLQHRIKKEGLGMNTKSDWRKLLQNYVDIPKSAERRYHWENCTISIKWDCLEFYGCNNPACPEKKALMDLRKRRVRGVRVKEVEDRLDKWGSRCPACSACGETAYCSPTCQKEHWPTHKPICVKKRKDRKK
ncbi:hypothetical protein QCA50_010758 [Cerrena zonata]|uniref:MYND-type domain-containing protein n=1 Tax=Cerrena zonata TaxID=2478898 RepID=A0AAW0FY08_9APHY